MPYNPSVTPDTTSIGNGIQNAGNSLIQGFNEMKQNKLMASTASAKFEGALQSNPEILKILTSENAPSDLASAFKKMQKGGQVGLKDAALLSTFAESVVEGKQRQQQEQARALQLQQAQQSAQQQEVANQRAGALAQFQSGIGNSLMTPQARKQMQGQLDNPVGQYIAQVYQYTGRAPSQDALTEFAKSVAISGSRGGRAAVEPETYTDTDPTTGKPITITIDKLTGKQIGTAPKQETRMYASPEEQARAAGLTEAAKKTAQNDADLLQGVTDAAEASQAIIPQIGQIRQLYKDGTASGFGQDFITKGAALAYRLGLGDAKSQADREQLQKLLAGQALTTAQQLMKGQGAVSNFERQLVTDAAASLDKSPAANLRIIELADALARRNVDMEMKRQEWMDAGEKDLPEMLRRWRSRNTLSSYMDKINESESKSQKALSVAEEIKKEYGLK